MDKEQLNGKIMDREDIKLTFKTRYLNSDKVKGMIRNLNIKHSIPTIKATFILVCPSISKKMIFMSGQGFFP